MKQHRLQLHVFAAALLPLWAELPLGRPMPYYYGAKNYNSYEKNGAAKSVPSPSLMVHLPPPPPPPPPPGGLPPWEKEGADPERYQGQAGPPGSSAPLALVALFGTLAAAAALPFAVWGGGGGWEKQQQQQQQPQMPELTKVQQQVEKAVRTMRDL